LVVTASSRALIHVAENALSKRRHSEGGTAAPGGGAGGSGNAAQTRVCAMREGNVAHACEYSSASLDAKQARVAGQVSPRAQYATTGLSALSAGAAGRLKDRWSVPCLLGADVEASAADNERAGSAAAAAAVRLAGHGSSWRELGVVTGAAAPRLGFLALTAVAAGVGAPLLEQPLGVETARARVQGASAACATPSGGPEAEALRVRAGILAA